jgi:hypothetical protein
MRHAGTAAVALLLGLAAGCTQRGIGGPVSAQAGGRPSTSAVGPGDGADPGGSKPPGVRPGPLPPALRGVTYCGLPYWFWVPDRWASAGSCAGLIAPVTVSVPVGSAFVVRLEHEQDGTLDVPVPRPDRTVVVVVDRHGYWVEYRAARVGAVTLWATHTRLCVNLDPRVGKCAVLRVHVSAG